VKQALLSASNIYYKRLASAGPAFLMRTDFEKILKWAPLQKLAQMLSALSVLTQTKVYLFWKNPKGSGVKVDPNTGKAQDSRPYGVAPPFVNNSNLKNSRAHKKRRTRRPHNAETAHNIRQSNRQHREDG